MTDKTYREKENDFFKPENNPDIEYPNINLESVSDKQRQFAHAVFNNFVVVTHYLKSGLEKRIKPVKLNYQFPVYMGHTVCLDIQGLRTKRIILIWSFI